MNTYKSMDTAPKDRPIWIDIGPTEVLVYFNDCEWMRQPTVCDNGDYGVEDCWRALDDNDADIFELDEALGWRDATDTEIKSINN